MSIEVMTRVWKESKQTECSRLLLLLALADHADPDGVCWPGIPHLARKIRKTERHVRRLLRDLEKSGDVYTGRNMGRRDTNLYYVTVGFTQKEIEDTLVERFRLTRGGAIDKATKIVTTPDADVIPDSYVTPDASVPPIPDASVPTPLTPASIPPDMDASLTIINHQDPSNEPSLSPIGEKSTVIVERIIKQTETHLDQFDLGRQSEIARDQAGGNYAVPPSAGGANSFADGPLDAFATCVAGISLALLPAKTRRSWAGKLYQIAQQWSTEERIITAEIMERAIRAVPDSDIGWKTYTSPYAGNFETDIGPLLLGGGQTKQGKAARRIIDPDKLDRATRMTLERLRHGNA